MKAHRAATRQVTVFEIIHRKNKTTRTRILIFFLCARSYDTLNATSISCESELNATLKWPDKRAPRVTWACRHALYTGVNMEPSRLGLCWTNKVSLQLKSASVESKNWKKNINKKGARFFAEAFHGHVCTTESGGTVASLTRTSFIISRRLNDRRMTRRMFNYIRDRLSATLSQQDLHLWRPIFVLSFTMNNW